MVPSMQGSIGVFRPPTPATPLPAEFFAEDDKRESEALEKFKQQPEAHLMSNDETTTTKPPTVSAKDLEAMTQEERDTHSMPPPPPPNAASGWQEMIAAAPALAESCAVVYVNAPVDELITRVLFVLRRDQIRQKDLATSINISGSTLSPMLRGKYRHTKDSHIAKLREWLYQRDKLFCATSLHQAVLKGLNEETLAAALGVERSLLARWLHFGLPFPERTTVDEHFLTWSGANTAAPSEETENITTSHRPSPAQSPRPFSRASNGSSLGNASSLSNSSSLSNGLSLGSATPPGTVSPLSTLDIRVQTAGLWRLPSTSTASNSNSGSLAGHTLSGVSSPYPATASSASSSPYTIRSRAQHMGLPQAGTQPLPQSLQMLAQSLQTLPTPQTASAARLSPFPSLNASSVTANNMNASSFTPASAPMAASSLLLQPQPQAQFQSQPQTLSHTQSSLSSLATTSALNGSQYGSRVLPQPPYTPSLSSALGNGQSLANMFASYGGPGVRANYELTGDVSGVAER